MDMSYVIESSHRLDFASQEFKVRYVRGVSAFLSAACHWPVQKLLQTSLMHILVATALAVKKRRRIEVQ